MLKPSSEDVKALIDEIDQALWLSDDWTTLIKFTQRPSTVIRHAVRFYMPHFLNVSLCLGPPKVPTDVAPLRDTLLRIFAVSDPASTVYL